MLSVSFFLFLLDYFGLFLFYIHGIIHGIILRLHVSRNPKPRTRSVTQIRFAQTQLYPPSFFLIHFHDPTQRSGNRSKLEHPKSKSKNLMKNL